MMPVSYTHLDVYKRQSYNIPDELMLTKIDKDGNKFDKKIATPIYWDATSTNITTKGDEFILKLNVLENKNATETFYDQKKSIKIYKVIIK